MLGAESLLDSTVAFPRFLSQHEWKSTRYHPVVRVKTRFKIRIVSNIS